jgi:hypothetical protein
MDKASGERYLAISVDGAAHWSDLSASLPG